MINTTRRLRQVLYRLKRALGYPVKIVQVTGKTFNAETGKQTLAMQVAEIQRAIVLPNVLQPRFAFDLAYIAHNRDFTYGATFEVGERRFIVETRDCPFRPGLDDTIIFEGRRWKVSQANEFDNDIGVLLTARESTNDSEEVVYDAEASNALALNQTASRELVHP